MRYGWLLARRRGNNWNIQLIMGLETTDFSEPKNIVSTCSGPGTWALLLPVITNNIPEPSGANRNRTVSEPTDRPL